MTPAQRKFLLLARNNKLGVVECTLQGGLARSNWHRMMDRLVKQGLAKAYVHGGYEITPAGVTALLETS